MRLNQVISTAIEKLSHSDTPRLDAEVLLCHVLDVTRSYLYAWSDKIITDNQYNQFQQLLEHRIKNVPIAYIMGHKEFWSLDLQVSENTLIPRPETELLVELVLAHLESDSQAKVIDLGTGSGAIALAIAKERVNCNVIATDKSTTALAIAKQNARNLGLEQVKFLQSDWLNNLGIADVIVSNPPYIAAADHNLNQHEPRTALVAGNDGLSDIRTIIAQAPKHLTDGGYLLLEHGYDQAAAVRQLLKQFKSVKTYQDLAGLDRVTVGVPRPIA
ncbi:peptide chain release factor N(5)-glutamine methyltransferase [Candidatus Marithrix sp. Canyon 246]|uniref:peptide chain release factor N(5)-glutamine methyltransferase n=1 Tax=Candidatus Marithrix sp. Canyon 246 TaxID=1827136 RepID=UPI00084A1A7B|nr:peptide chain release factor N(5)-glutamine methyltransferase [Candidatus Marithrix sp. Canyon 246]